VAFSLKDIDRIGYSIVFSEMEGRKFNFDIMDFEDPK